MDIGPWEISGILFVAAIILLAWRFGPSSSKAATSRSSRAAARVAPAAPPPVAVVVPQVICANCQRANPATNRFCSECGQTLVALAETPDTPTEVAVENTCPSCATINPPGQVFCGQCGTRLTPAAA